jgi:ribosomal protein S18 acetylase RimI-like enzyme
MPVWTWAILRDNELVAVMCIGFLAECAEPGAAKLVPQGEHTAYVLQSIAIMPALRRTGLGRAALGS